MANKKPTKKGTSTQVRKAPPIRAPGMRLSDAAARYAKLLADPCNADLVPGPFGDGYGGLVARFEREYVINNSATDTASFLAFYPATGAVFIAPAAITDDITTFTPTVLPAASCPGYQFIQTNSSYVRPLAACVQMYWPGSELNRQGVVSLGRHGGEVLSDTTSVGAYRAQANYVKRMPSDCFEMVWRPTETDLIMREWSATTNTSTFNGTSAIVATATGIPASTGVRYRVVVVYEWMPDPASGFKNVIVRTPNPHRLADIIAALDRAGDWMSGTATAAARAISSLAGGVGSIMALGNGATRIGRAMLAY